MKDSPLAQLVRLNYRQWRPKAEKECRGPSAADRQADCQPTNGGGSEAVGTLSTSAIHRLDMNHCVHHVVL